MLGFTTILECISFSFISGLNRLLQKLRVKQVLYISCNNYILLSNVSHTEKIFATSTVDINMKLPSTEMKEHQQHTGVICVKFMYK